MKRFLVKLIGLCLSVVLTVIGIAMVVLLVIPPQFQDTAFSVIVRKYDLLCKSESPKVIIVGGSSGGFGIDRQLLEDKLGLPVCNMALAAGLGMPFSTNLIRDNLQEGDLVVLAYEYGHWSSLNENMQPEVIMAAVDGRPELLKYIEPTSLDKLLQYYPTYMFKKLNSFLVRPIQGSGVNCSDAYNESGDLIYSRPACTLSEPINVSVQIRSDWIDPAFVQYVNNFIELANSKGAQVVISCPPLLDEAVVSSSEEILQFEQTLDEQVDCPIISHVEDYIYSRELMFDTVYHCNERGMEKRTTQLANDLFTYFIGQQGKVPAEYLENESIRDKLMDLYRDCFGLLSEYTEFETVNLVRDWAYAKIPFSTSMKLSIYNDEIYSPDAGSFASNFLELTNQNRGGYYCGGTAYGLASIYRMLGYDSFALDLAIFDGGNVVDSHVVTLVDISSDNEPFWCVQDAFFNL